MAGPFNVCESGSLRSSNIKFVVERTSDAMDDARSVQSKWSLTIFIVVYVDNGFQCYF